MADGLNIGSLSLSGGVPRLTGTSSKLDTEAIIAAAYAAKRQPAVRLEQRIARNEARSGALVELRTILDRLQDSVAGLRNPPGLLGVADNLFEAKQAFLTATGSTAAEEFAGVTVENRAATGSFSLTVDRLATAHKLMARPLGAEGQSLAEAWSDGAGFAGTLEVGLADGAKAAVTVRGDMTADDLRAAINAVSAQSGVTAAIVSVSAGERRLVLSASETGRAIELADTAGDAITAMLAPMALQAPQAAQIRVDGIAIERPTNRIDDVLPGVTLDLYRAEAGTVLTVKVEPSLAGVKERLVGFVAGYNELRDFVAQHGMVGGDGKIPEDAILFGDRTLRGLAQSLAGLAGSSVRGLVPDAPSTLRDVGITMEAGGRLRVDEAKLDARLLGQLDQVRKVFEFTTTASAGGLVVYERSNGLTDLAFAVEITDADGDGRAEAVTLDGVPALVDGGVIEGAPGTIYAGLKLIWSGRGSTTIDLAVSPGLADQFYNALASALDEKDGPISRSLGELEAANRDHSSRIEQIDGRAVRARELLAQRLAAMESALSLANTMLTQVRAQMDAMNRSS